MEAQVPFPLKLFYCYARTDKTDRDELEQHLAGVKRKYQMTSWSDQEISPGAEWEKAIEAHLKTADVILLLVSARFMASDYCYSVEMQRALERHDEGTALVIPILLHPVYLENAPFEKLQMLPSDAKPISKWANRDEAFWDVATGIARAIAELINKWPSRDEWTEKGYTLLDLNRFEEALVAYEHALRLDPSHADDWYFKGDALRNLNRFEEALAAFEHALRLDPSDEFSWNGKGNALYSLKRFEAALAAFEHALRLNPSNTFSWGGKGDALFDLKRFEEALSAHEHALSLDPNNEYIKQARQRALEALGRAR